MIPFLQSILGYYYEIGDCSRIIISGAWYVVRTLYSSYRNLNARLERPVTPTPSHPRSRLDPALHALYSLHQPFEALSLPSTTWTYLLMRSG